MFMEDKGLTTSLSSNADSRKKFGECPLAVRACAVKPHSVSPRAVQGPWAAGNI